jgi:hypothetical protein
MQHIATQQLDSIQSMLSIGHRNLRVERHSLLLWGAGGGAIILLSSYILTPEQIPTIGLRAFAWLIFLTLYFSAIGIVDWHLTRRAKVTREETWPFLHRQILKVWWLLISIGILLTFAMFFYGGGHMLFPAWLVLTGLGLYIHGLFSEELLVWTGVLSIAIGVGILAFNLNAIASQWIAASTLGLGFPLLSFMLDRNRQRTHWIRLAQSVVWLLCVVCPPMLAQQLSKMRLADDVPVVSLEAFKQHPKLQQIVSLPAGSLIPVKVDISGDLFRSSNLSVLPLVLNGSIEIMMNGGQPTGQWRYPDERWLSGLETLRISIPVIKAVLAPETDPEIRSSLIVESNR